MSTMSPPTCGVQPSLLDTNHCRDGIWPLPDQGVPKQASPATALITKTSLAANTLSPYAHIASRSASPLHYASTPADSLSAFSDQYPASDFGDNLDPFYGVDFNDVEGGTPSFLEDPAEPLEDYSDQSESYPQTACSAPARNVHDPLIYPLSPDPTPTVHKAYSSADLKSSAAFSHTSPESISHASLEPPRSGSEGIVSNQLKPHSRSETNAKSSGEEGSALTAAPVPNPSPRVIVSMWGQHQAQNEHSFPEEDKSLAAFRADGTSDDVYLTSASYRYAFRDGDDPISWVAPAAAGPNGWGPENRSSKHGVSVNKLDMRRKVTERNQEVDRWIEAHEGVGSPGQPPTPLRMEDDGIPQGEIPLGNKTENKPLPGQTYYTERGGPLTEDDRKLMRQHRVWADAPTVYPIDDSERTQPETAQAAMQQFDFMCQETGSILSRTATWGTRRRSLPSIADMDGVTSGNFFKKLSISRERKSSFLFKELRGLIRKPGPTQLLKRNRSTPGDEDFEEDEAPECRRESRENLPTSLTRRTSWKKAPMPSLNTALVSMATGAAAIGTRHARTSSISNVPSPPKTPFFKNGRRSRSRSEFSKSYSEESHSNLVGMWKKSGGPPVPHLARTSVPELEDEEEEEDDLNEESDGRTGASCILDDLTPNLAGFKQQVLLMNPSLADQNTYLLDRIAHQQVVRYKELLNKRVKHLQQTNAGTCASGTMCMASGGSAICFDGSGESRGMDALATTYEAGSDGDAMPMEGAITAESFPSDIPIPPTTSLPAEFECQLCYSTKKFTKPSDWTKHVHEDVQPFTCTWDRCREPKIFKRKADWVRHESEGHRHLEWWTCDVEDCRHTCYRRDNFLQHLVREHKFPEPKIKTKAAIKRAGAQDMTWQRVEKCHADTPRKPQDEPCRFCGKTLPTWKKLTVHLAKHMEEMSLPILRLVARMELDANTIISPVQDPPPRSFPPVKSESQSYTASPSLGHTPAMGMQQGPLAFPGSAHPSYTHLPSTAFPGFYDNNMHGLPQASTMSLGGHQADVASTYSSQTSLQNLTGSPDVFMASNQFHTMPHTMAPQLEPFPAYSNPLGLQSASGTQTYGTTTMSTCSFSGEQQPHQQHQQQHHRHRHHHHQQQQQHYGSQAGSASPYSRSPHLNHGGFYH